MATNNMKALIAILVIFVVVAIVYLLHVVFVALLILVINKTLSTTYHVNVWYAGLLLAMISSLIKNITK